jgi:hypothetical protein
MRVNRGSNLVEYVIPAALIGLIVGLGLYMAIENGYLMKFFVSTTGGKLENNKLAFGITENVSAGAHTPDSGDVDVINVGDSVDTGPVDMSDALNLPSENPGELPANDDIATAPTDSQSGDTSIIPDTPQETQSAQDAVCNNGVCTVQVGNILLDGIPENFSDFVQTSGSAIGTDTIAGLLRQIAEQVADDGEPQSANIANWINMIAENSELATSGSIGSIERIIEQDVEYKAYQMIENLNPDGGSNFAMTDMFYNMIVNQCNQNPEKYSDVKDMVTLLYKDGIKQIGATFYNEVKSGTTDPESINNKVASTTTDIKAQLLKIANNP